MVTNAEKPEVEAASSKVGKVARLAIAGHPQGAVRRIILYLVTYLAIVVATVGPDLASFAAFAVALTVLSLLAMTDQLA